VLELSGEGLSVVRTIRAPLADVYDAWVNPERLVSWWGPPGVTVASIEGDLRVGGRYLIVMRRGGEEIELEWTFVEIRPLRRLVFEWRFARGDGEPRERSLVTIAFHERGEETQVALTHIGIVSPGARESHAAGWAGCFDGLQRILTQMG
jgi:uncharacterized protein YndB with AHSA1/START domain